MIIEDFLVFNQHGLYCRTGDFYLDPHHPVKDAFISHAHADHAIRGNQHVYCTAATAALMEWRYQNKAGKKFTILQYEQRFEKNGVEITFFPAGHMLGSAQILLIYKGIRYLYTGDFKLQSDLTCEPLKFIEAEVLIIETTFASPSTQHPHPIAEIEKLNTKPQHIVLGAYAMGKAQRLTSLINRYCQKHTVLIHHSILPIHKIYESFGYPLGHYIPYRRNMMKETLHGYLYIVPPFTFKSYHRAKNVLRIFASGWKNLQTSEMELLLSDHADWNDLITMINKVKPQRIWTLHGDGSFLKAYYDQQIPVKLLNTL